MILIVCIDDKNGMLFHNRRQSQDRVLRERLLVETSDSKLWMNEYTYMQFEAAPASHIVVDDDFLEKAGCGEYCFAENLPVAFFENRLEEIILYKWNRVYPADLFFDISLEKSGWKMIQSEDFSGSSHEKITKEVYRR